MTRQEKINKVARFCAATECRNCEVLRVSCPIRAGLKWSNAEESTLDTVIAVIDKADKPTEQTANDPVNHPSHYTAGGVECIDALNAMMQGYKTADTGALAWQIVKYIWRAPLKGNMAQDIRKAKFYLDRLLAKVEGGT